MTTPTANYGWIKPDVGASNDAWGGLLNTDLDGIDSTVKSVSNVANAAYPASNPSGYQTAAQVTASLGAYLPLAGGTLTGALNGTAATFSGQLMTTGGNVVSRALGAGNAAFVMQNNAGTNVGTAYWTPAGAVGLQQISSSASAYLDSAGVFNTSGKVLSGVSYVCRAGSAGAAAAQGFNLYWTGSATQLWIDSTNAGNITVSSDYRIKKDVADLPSMWERAKGLRPISYTHQDYTPPNAPAKEDGSAPLPHIVGDDVERWGFVAHELQETLILDAATGVKDQEDCIQSPNVMTIVATLTKALQEAMARIEALEAARG